MGSAIVIFYFMFLFLFALRYLLFIILYSLKNENLKKSTGNCIKKKETKKKRKIVQLH